MFHRAKELAKTLFIRLCSCIPVQKNHIVFYVHQKQGLCGNPKYIMLYLHEHIPGMFRFYWASSYPHTVENEDWFTVLRHGSLRYFFVLTTARVVITDDGINGPHQKRRGQLYISTWHGGGTFKKVGFDTAHDEGQLRYLNEFYRGLDYMVVSCKRQAELYQTAFRLLPEQMVASGMPRTDILFSKAENRERQTDIVLRVRKAFSIPEGAHLLLYAPTYRKDRYALLEPHALEQVLAALSAMFGGEWVCLYRTHYLGTKFKVHGKAVHDATNWPDVQELELASEVLVTDYSSVLWDMSLMKKLCLLYVPDTETYIANNRDFFEPFSAYPYPKASNLRELVRAIEHFEKEPYDGAVQRYLSRCGCLDDGKSTERFCRWLMAVIET